MKKNERKSPFSGKILGYKKPGILKAKKYKNRIYLRKKGNNINREKKDFFPPYHPIKRQTFDFIEVSKVEFCPI